MTEQTLQLKVLTGRNTGALLPLDIGEYLIGSGDSCAIILLDHDVEEEHCLLEVETDGVRILPQDGSVLINGEEVAAGGASFQLFQAVFIGETALALGMEGDGWPDIELRPPADDGIKKQDGEGSEQDIENEQEQSDTTEAAQPKQPAEKSLLRVWGLALVLLLLLTGLSVRAYLNLETPGFPTSLENLSQQVSAIIQEKEITGVQVNSDEDILTVSGYITDSKTLKDISADILATAPQAVIQLTVTENLLTSVRQVLAIYDLADISVTVDLQGLVTLQGEVKDNTVFKKAVAAIEQDVPGISGINNQTTLLHKPAAALPEKKMSFPVNEVSGVVVGKTSFISMENGVIYKPGSLLPGGCSILSISRDILSLNCDGTEKRYPLLP